MKSLKSILFVFMTVYLVTPAQAEWISYGEYCRRTNKNPCKPFIAQAGGGMFGSSPFAGPVEELLVGEGDLWIKFRVIRYGGGYHGTCGILKEVRYNSLINSDGSMRVGYYMMKKC